MVRELRGMYKNVDFIGMFLNGFFYCYDDDEYPTRSMTHSLYRAFSVSCCKLRKGPYYPWEKETSLEEILEDIMRYLKHLWLFNIIRKL